MSVCVNEGVCAVDQSTPGTPGSHINKTPTYGKQKKGSFFEAKYHRHQQRGLHIRRTWIKFKFQFHASHHANST